MVNITSSTYCPGELQGGSSSIATQGDGTLTLYPNPNNVVSNCSSTLTEVGADVNTVSVDIYDLMGKRVTARTIAVADGFVNSAMDVHAIASGMYMVNITARREDLYRAAGDPEVTYRAKARRPTSNSPHHLRR
jgi:hypothetical protein